MSTAEPRRPLTPGHTPSDGSTRARDGELPPVAAPAEACADESARVVQTPARTIRAFYEQAVARPDVRELLSRLAKKQSGCLQEVGTKPTLG